MQRQFNYPIAWAKAICIMLMVIGHSGCPTYLHDMIYLFHVPLFFVCSGYLFKIPNDFGNLVVIIKKRIKGLWFPFVKWSLLFLLLNNLFFKWHLLGSHHNQCLLSISDMTHTALKILFMSEAPILVAGFWFLRVLLISIVLTAILTFIRKIRPIYIITFSFIGAIILQFIDIFSVFSYSMSILFMGIGFHAVGMWYREHEDNINVSFWQVLMFFVIISVIPLFFHAEMISFDKFSIIPFVVLASLLSILLMTSLKWLNSKGIVHCKINSLLVFISSNTLEILALHFLCFKVVSYVIIVSCKMPINNMCFVPTIPDISGFWWMLYSLVGIIIPLMTVYLWRKLKTLFIFNK